LICLALPERGLGIAVRIADGTYRAHEVVVPAVLEQLAAVDASVFAAVTARNSPVIRNHNRWHVGDLRAAFTLQTG
jgi:L-asparaginase II